MEEDELVTGSDAHEMPRMQRVLARVQISDWIASIAAVAAIVSLVISVLGYRLASEQTALARDQFAQTRSFWWLCTVDDDLNLTLTPSRDDAVVESVLIVFPKSLFRDAEQWALKPREFRLSLQDIQKRLMSSRASEVTFDKATGRYNVHAVRNELPLIVESRYMVGGSMQADRTLFFLRIRTRFSMGPKGVDNVTLESLSLGDAFMYGKLPNDADDTDETLSKYWDLPGSDVVAQVAPIGGKITMEGPFPPRGNSKATK